MLIGIDGNEANVNAKVGVHQYAFEILWSIYKLKNEWKDKHEVVIYLKNPPNKDLPGEKKFWKYKVLSGSGVWIITKLMPQLSRKPRPNVFFAPSHYLPPLTTMPKVCTIHDLGYLESSGQFKKYDFWQLKLWSAISIYISKYIIAVSESTKKDIVRHYPSTSEKVTVTLHGYDKDRYNLNISSSDVRRVKKKYKIHGDYILSLGTIKPSKNIDGLLEGYKELITHHGLTKTKLVIAGKKGWLFKSVFEKAKELKLTKNVVFTDFVEEKYKPAFYTGAKVFVSPSHWEGFGMQVLEAMACGTPVVISNVASLPEVAGEAGVYVNSNDSKSIAMGIKKVLTMDSKRYNKLVKKTLVQAEKFSWENSARKLIKQIEKAGR